MTKLNFKILIPVLVLALSIPVLLRLAVAQESREVEIRGVVVDSSNAGLSGVQVLVQPNGHSAGRVGKTGPDGHYNVSFSLSSGESFNVTFDDPGGASISHNQLSFAGADRSLIMDVELYSGNMSAHAILDALTSIEHEFLYGDAAEGVLISSEKEKYVRRLLSLAKNQDYTSRLSENLKRLQRQKAISESNYSMLTERLGSVEKRLSEFAKRH